VIDTKLKEGAKSFYDTVIKIAGKKPIVIVNTHIHSDHVEGNSMYQGQTIIAGANYDHEQWIKENGKRPAHTMGQR
jgi:glyoxylase-like metal-dependent hydrolase (beta-lactamase superfamily II)